MRARLLERPEQGLGQARLQLLQRLHRAQLRAGAGVRARVGVRVGCGVWAVALSRLLDGREPSVGRVALLLAPRRAGLESELLLLRLGGARSGGQWEGAGSWPCLGSGGG